MDIHYYILSDVDSMYNHIINFAHVENFSNYNLVFIASFMVSFNFLTASVSKIA